MPEQGNNSSQSANDKMVAIIERAYADSSFRGKIIYFPERVIAVDELPILTVGK